jgi:hypothetical protein
MLFDSVFMLIPNTICSLLINKSLNVKITKYERILEDFATDVEKFDFVSNKAIFSKKTNRTFVAGHLAIRMTYYNRESLFEQRGDGFARSWSQSGY